MKRRRLDNYSHSDFCAITVCSVNHDLLRFFDGLSLIGFDMLLHLFVKTRFIRKYDVYFIWKKNMESIFIWLVSNFNRKSFEKPYASLWNIPIPLFNKSLNFSFTLWIIWRINWVFQKLDSIFNFNLSITKCNCMFWV